NICAKIPALRQAAKRCMKPLTNITYKNNVKLKIGNKNNVLYSLEAELKLSRKLFNFITY
ncbi:hypothetical protein, partial [Flavobacterium cyanobacteriorum]|uniref:hypothetical protein n=1 Tax=Flavobacterium cyanobacteriorum TaxID=2022802 RepID=UPI001A9C5565